MNIEPEQKTAPVTEFLPYGTLLENQYGIWVIISITHFRGDTWYGIRQDCDWAITCWPSEIGKEEWQYRVVEEVK